MLSPKQYQNNEKEMEHEPSCPLAQQFTGSMFGFIIGYTVLHLVGPGILTQISVCCGVSYGLLGAREVNPFNMELNEWLKLFFLSIFVSVPFSALTYFDLMGLILLSFIVSILSSHIKFWIDLFNIQHPQKSYNSHVV
jgi:hypothetical protein